MNRKLNFKKLNIILLVFMLLPILIFIFELTVSSKAEICVDRGVPCLSPMGCPNFCYKSIRIEPWYTLDSFLSQDIIIVGSLSLFITTCLTLIVVNLIELVRKTKKGKRR